LRLLVELHFKKPIHEVLLDGFGGLVKNASRFLTSVFNTAELCPLYNKSVTEKCALKSISVGCD